MKDGEKERTSWMSERVRKFGYTQVPHMLFTLAENDGLPAVERSLLVGLLGKIRRNSPTVSASFAELARTTGWSRSVVVEGMKRLAARTPKFEERPAYLVPSSGKRASGPATSNKYSLEPLLKRLEVMAQVKAGEVGGLHPTKLPASLLSKVKRKRGKSTVEGFGYPDHDWPPEDPRNE